MARPKLWRVVLCFVVLYGILLLPWLDFQPAYGRYIQGVGSLFFGSPSPHLVLFRARGTADNSLLDSMRTVMLLVNSDNAKDAAARMVGLDTKQIFWIPFSFYLALIGATPMSWFRRAWSLVWGILTAHVIVILYLMACVATHSADIGMIYLSPFGQSVSAGVVKLLSVVSGPSILVYFFVWVFAAFRCEDLGRWVNGWQSSIATPIGDSPTTRQQKRAQLRAARKSQPRTDLTLQRSPKNQQIEG